ncbi:hypothetical protein Tco_0811222 [Tanacetum coccineum]
MAVYRALQNISRLVEKQGDDINGYTFYTKKQHKNSTLRNTRVTLIAATPEFSIGDHEASVSGSTTKWGVRVEDYGFTSVNISINGYASEPFILAKEANKIFFFDDPSDSRWHIVLHGKRHIIGVENVVDEDKYD